MTSKMWAEWECMAERVANDIAGQANSDYSWRKIWENHRKGLVENDQEKHERVSIWKSSWDRKVFKIGLLLWVCDCVKSVVKKIGRQKLRF